jgi:hypothetical protein
MAESVVTTKEIDWKSLVESTDHAEPNIVVYIFSGEITKTEPQDPEGTGPYA